MKQELIEAIKNNQFNKLGYYNFHLNRLDTIKREMKNSLTILRVNLRKDLD